MKKIKIPRLMVFFILIMLVSLPRGIGRSLAGQAALERTFKPSDTAGDKKPSDVTDEEWEKIKAKRPLPFDNGPAIIDVSKYPAEMQDIYKNVFSVRCSKCHTIARPINAPYALPEEWFRYIKKMMKKPGSGITPETGKMIAKFLIYDSQQRKADAIAKKLKEKESAPPVKK